MSIEPVFLTRFEQATAEAYTGGLKAAVFTGMGSATGNALTYAADGESVQSSSDDSILILRLSTALMFYVGAILIIKGRYDFAKMTQVFALIIFSITFAAQVMVYCGYLVVQSPSCRADLLHLAVPGIAKACQAAIDLWRLLALTTDTKESEGRMTFPIKGDVTFDGVNFSYPSRPDVPILRNASFTVKAGECVGIVG